jgi:hypothetical protein
MSEASVSGGNPEKIDGQDTKPHNKKQVKISESKIHASNKQGAKKKKKKKKKKKDIRKSNVLQARRTMSRTRRTMRFR